MLLSLSNFCDAIWQLCFGFYKFNEWKQYYYLILVSIETLVLIGLIIYLHSIYCQFKHFSNGNGNFFMMGNHNNPN